MVVGRDFAWGHMGKTGGDATYVLFQCVPDLVVSAHLPEDPSKHQSFGELGVVDKNFLLNMRRLPSLVLSHVHHAKNYGLGPEFPTGSRITPEQAISLPRPERMIRKHTDDGRLSIHRWLRMENLRDDFLDFVGTIRPVTVEEERRIQQVTTKAPMRYNHDVRRFFTERQIEQLYLNNPLWARYELFVYGDLPVNVPVA